jgi:hypothetical protein
MAEQTSLTLDQIKALFPNEWVLLGNPVIKNAQVLSGIVIFHNADKRKLADSEIDWRQYFNNATSVFTGEFPKNRKFWL